MKYIACIMVMLISMISVTSYSESKADINARLNTEDIRRFVIVDIDNPIFRIELKDYDTGKKDKFYVSLTCPAVNESMINKSIYLPVSNISNENLGIKKSDVYKLICRK